MEGHGDSTICSRIIQRVFEVYNILQLFAVMMILLIMVIMRTSFAQTEEHGKAVIRHDPSMN